MSRSHEQGELPTPHEIIFQDYGTYVVTNTTAFPLHDDTDPSLGNADNVVLASYPSWHTIQDVLTNTNFGNTTVLTPELITIAGEPLADMDCMKEVVTKSFGKIRAISQSQPEATFVFGTPYFIEEAPKPFNTAVVVKDGQIQAVEKKRLITGIEREYFSVSPEASPTSIDDSTVLVCRDLIAAQQTLVPGRTDRISDYMMRATGDTALAKRFRGTEFIAPGSKRLLVSSLWGVGASDENLRSDTQEEVNSYYLGNLQGVGRALLNLSSHVQQIVVCDRTPEAVGLAAIASRPMSGAFFKR